MAESTGNKAADASAIQGTQPSMYFDLWATDLARVEALFTNLRLAFRTISVRETGAFCEVEASAPFNDSATLEQAFKKAGISEFSRYLQPLQSLRVLHRRKENPEEMLEQKRELLRQVNRPRAAQALAA